MSVQLFAQERTITGTVSSDQGTPLEGVTVTNAQTNRKTTTNAAGSFSIVAANGHTLVFTSVGFVSQRIQVSANRSYNISLSATSGQLEDVVVTAMDIKRNPRELGYSVQTVKGSDIAQTQRENFINGMQGRVAGLTVTPTSGAAGGSSSIVLRGFNTLSGNNQPLFIVDGIILDNQSLNTNSQGGSGIGLASDGANRNSDATNRIADINPNDIESVTVLKGPEATALYGSQASNGAIVITTKRAKGTAGKIRVSYDNNFRMQKINRFAEVNNDYGPGSSGIPTPPPLAGQFTSFGPVWKEGTPLFDNLHHFYRTGFSQTHNLGLEFGKENVGFRLSGQYFDSKGVIPYNSYTKYNFKLSNNTKLGEYITITPSIAYSKSDNVKPTKGLNGYLQSLYLWPANNDIRDFENEYGGKNQLFNANYNSDYDNPLWSAKNNKAGDFNERWIGTLGVDINPFKWLSLAGRFGYDTYKQDGYLFTHPQSFLLTVAQGGTLDNYYRTYKGYNHTITATAKKTIGKFSTRLLGGTMWQDLETSQFGIFGTNLKDSSSTDSSNTLEGSRRRLLRNYFGLPNLRITRQLAFFGEAFIGYKNLAFLTYSHRFESA
ncbi:MAG TPA: TonB-dependent receptor plug domain-containing protein, partial [Segetibacter sp.]